MTTLNIIKKREAMFSTYEFIYESEKEKVFIGETVARYAEKLFKHIMTDLDFDSIVYFNEDGRRSVPEFLCVYIEDYQIDFEIKKLKGGRNL